MVKWFDGLVGVLRFTVDRLRFLVGWFWLIVHRFRLFVTGF